MRQKLKCGCLILDDEHLAVMDCILGHGHVFPLHEIEVERVMNGEPVVLDGAKWIIAQSATLTNGETQDP